MDHIALGLANVLAVVFQMIQLVVLASIIVSWVSADPNNPIVRIITSISEPLYRPFRRLTRNLPGPIDWAPMIVILLVIFLQSALVGALRSMAVPSY